VPSSGKLQSAEELLAEDHEALAELLSALLAEFAERDAPAAFAHLDLFWARLAMHIRAEHLHLFPAILGALPGDPGKCADGTPSTTKAREAIAQLRSDHDFFMHELARAVKIMREFPTQNGSSNEAEVLDNVRQIISAVNDRLKLHNTLEEELVYRLPEKLLEVADQSALEVQIRDELKNLPPRFSDKAG
jgi:hypothetical protein